MHKTLRRLLPLAVVVCLLAQSIVTLAHPSSPALSGPAHAVARTVEESDVGAFASPASCITSWFDISTREGARAAYLNNCLGTFPPCLGSLDDIEPHAIWSDSCRYSLWGEGEYTWWTGSEATCTPGVTTVAFQQTAVDALAYYRAWAGVSPRVGLVEEYNRKAQAVALYNASGNFISGTYRCPKTADVIDGLANTTYTKPGLFGGVNAGPAFIHANLKGWVRLAILNPRTVRYGIGAAVWSPDNLMEIYNALWIADRQATRPATRDGFVAWPPPGWVPYTLVDPNWTFSLDGADFSQAKVKATLDGYPLSDWRPAVVTNANGESTLHLNSGYTYNYEHWSRPNFDKTVRIEIADVLLGGTKRTYSYEVNVFDPEVATAQPPATIVITPSSGPNGHIVRFTGERWLGDAPRFSWDGTWGFEEQSGQYPTQLDLTWNPDGTISGSFVIPDNLPAGSHLIELYGTGRRYARTAFTVTSSTSPTPTPTARPLEPVISLSKEKSKYNGKIAVTLSGFRPNATITVRWQDGTVLATAQADGAGAASTNFRTPLAPLGTYDVHARDSSGKTATAKLRVIPRIKLTAYSGPVGLQLRVYYYGFAPGERVEIRWYDTSGTNFQVLKVVTIASNGRGTTLINVPAGSEPGVHQISGKVIGVSRSASDKFTVTTGSSLPSPESDPRSPTSTATVTPTPSEEPEQSVTPTTAPQETPTPEPTPLSTEEPTFEPTPIPTEEPTAEPTPLLTSESTQEPTVDDEGSEEAITGQ